MGPGNHGATRPPPELEDPDPVVRATACLDLGESNDPQAFWWLARVLKNDNGLVPGAFLPTPVRAAAAAALGRLQDERAVDHLSRALQDRGDDRFWDAVASAPDGDLVSYDDVNAVAAEALGAIGNPSSIEALSAAARRHPSPFVRGAAARAIGAIAEKCPNAYIPEEVLELTRRSHRLDRARLEAALTRLETSDPDIARLLASDDADSGS